MRAGWDGKRVLEAGIVRALRGVGRAASRPRGRYPGYTAGAITGGFHMSTVVTFDTLAYANKLKSVNIPAEQAEMQAEAMRDILEAAFHTAELATKTDINLAIALVRKDMEAMEQRVNAKIDAMMNTLVIRLTGAMIILATVTGTLVTLASRFSG